MGNIFFKSIERTIEFLSNHWRNLILTVLGIGISAGLILMVIEYRANIGRQFSHDPAVWGQFGDYFGLIVNIINTIAVLFLGYLVYVAQGRRDKWEKHYLAAQEKPLLRFVAWDGTNYRLYNMGKGPAHKIIIGKIQSGETSIATPTYKGYSIPSSAYLDVTWSTNSSTLYAYYEGEENNYYIVQCYEDENIDMTENAERKQIESILKNNAKRKESIFIHSY